MIAAVFAAAFRVLRRPGFLIPAILIAVATDVEIASRIVWSAVLHAFGPALIAGLYVEVDTRAYIREPIASAATARRTTPESKLDINTTS